VVEATLGEASTLTGLETPALVVLGPVSRYREVLDWYRPELRGNALG
jgi:uroporphyrin-III C-methyltransferase